MSDVPLREHLEALIREHDRRYEQRFEAQEKAVHVALEQTRIRFENVNEWRGTVTDLLANTMQRREGEARTQANSDKINTLATRMDRLEGKGLGVNAVWAGLAAAALLVIGVIGFFLKGP